MVNTNVNVIVILNALVVANLKTILKALKSLRVTLLIGVLAACGGGGGGSAPGSGDPGFSLGRDNIAVTAYSNAALPPTEAIAITIYNTAEVGILAAGVPPGTPVPGWLTFGLTGSKPNYTLSLTLNTSGLAAGSYPVTIRVASIKPDGTSVLGYRDIAFTYTVKPGLLITPSVGLLFTQIKANPPPPAATVMLVGDPVSWTTTMAAPAWVTGVPVSGAGPTSFSVAVSAATLAVGTYNSTIEFTTAQGQVIKLPMTFVVQ
jgi:hypothetical protein